MSVIATPVEPAFHTVPLSVIAEPPLLEIVAPNVAPVEEVTVAVGAAITGGDGTVTTFPLSWNSSIALEPELELPPEKVNTTVIVPV